MSFLQQPHHGTLGGDGILVQDLVVVECNFDSGRVGAVVLMHDVHLDFQVKVGVAIVFDVVFEILVSKKKFRSCCYPSKKD